MRAKLFAAVVLAMPYVYCQELASGSMVTVRAHIHRTSTVHPLVLERARVLAVEILAAAGVQLEWRRPDRKDSDIIEVGFDEPMPPSFHPEALAYAAPFAQGGTVIHILYDRVRNITRGEGTPEVLAHVLAHEIGHIVRGDDGHAATGVMKARWDAHDYFDMRRHVLSFSAADIELIHANFRRFKRLSKK